MTMKSFCNGSPTMGGLQHWLFAFVCCVSTFATHAAPMVIAEVYNGGGKTGATCNRDYVVLKNISGTAVNVSNWSLQHDKAGVWQTPFVLPNVTIPAGGFYLVQCYFDGGTANGAVLTPDATTPQLSAWNFSTSAGGAVALVNNSSTLTSCASVNVVDLVGWVSTAGNCYEGPGVPAPGGATLSNQRLANGCQDTDSNTNDFALATPTARNSSTALAPCAEPPGILNDPQSQTVALGSPATFTITVTGSSPLTFQWRKTGSPIADATNQSHTISSVTTNDLGSYDVIVTNKFGVDTSNGATLSLAPTNQQPSLTSQPASQSVTTGANVSFSVAASGAAPLNYHWRKNGATIANATNTIYSLSNVTTNNAGGFDVVVTNSFGSVTSALATLTVTPTGTNSSNVNPADYINPSYANVTVTSGVKFADVVNYKGVPTSLYLDVYQPTGDTNTSRPVIVWIHGGGFRTGSSRTQGYIVTYATEFAKRGYVCFSIDYRLRSTGDMPTQESELPAEQDAAADCNTAFTWLRTNAAAYAINTNWMFVGGGSAGGRTANVFSFHEGPDTNVCASCTSAILTNGVNVVPPVNWNRSGVIANADLWGSPEPVMRWYVLDSNDVPTVIIHGTADATIDYQNSVDLYNGLVSAGATVELNPLPGLGHTPTSANSQIIPWVANFFAQEWTKKLASVVTPPPAVTPPHLSGAVMLTNGGFQFSFTNVASANFTVLGTTNVSLPLSNWTPLGPATEIAPGQYQFTDAGSTSNAARYYRVRSP